MTKVYDKIKTKTGSSELANDEDDVNINVEKLERAKKNDLIDAIYGYDENKDFKGRLGWLINMKPTDIIDSDNKRLVSAMVYYFLQEDGVRFKSVLIYKPYFYVGMKNNTENEVLTFLRKKYASHLANIELLEKVDLDLPNHLAGLNRKYLKLSFFNTDDLIFVRQELIPKIRRNKKQLDDESAYNSMMAAHFAGVNETESDRSEKYGRTNALDNLVEIREYDVPYQIRVSIDLGIFVGKWYYVSGSGLLCKITPRDDVVDLPDPVVLAYDIETTKLPLKFPNSESDQVMMISYVVDGQGYLICNREILSDDIEDFEFTPRPEFPGPFSVFNESDEKATLLRFFEHIRELRPNIFVTYNGDSFDWPFVERRAAMHAMDMADWIGVSKTNQGEYRSRNAAHMDAFKWVQRDSYLPVGAQGLKAVCKAKLRYDPVEVDPEDMCRLAREEPRRMANYSVSDAVATYYLYMKYVHPFIFALCTIIPMDPDDILRKGSGTLCESLLMVEAFKANIIYPNKQESKLNELTEDGHLLESETYVGGHVEAIESGVFRSDIPIKFRIVPAKCQDLRDSLRKTLQHAVEVEGRVPIESVLNFDEVVQEVDEKLAQLQSTPNRLECPIIYHLDVAAMYPNIILSNRLQPSAIVDEKACLACDHNVPNARCKRLMKWVWRGEVMPASKSEYYLIQSQLEKEKFKPSRPGKPMRSWHQLTREEQAAAERDRLGIYCRTAYKRKHDTKTEERCSLICQKENSFYVDTVRAFRDRRYEFKDLTKVWKKNFDKLVEEGGDAAEIKRANNLLIVYDSLQLAHKCILNSFYGYVMRKGARWFSMEMAGVVCCTGAEIIKQAREIIEQVGRPLELDTDGIWCVLPASFPENLVFRTNIDKRKVVVLSYPGAMLNIMVQSRFTNDQYHDLVDPVNRVYSVHSENSIFFEVDGPYHAMILPAAKEQGKKLKKRYAVFNRDGSLAELKGFEVKRNGELNLIKIFQSSVFDSFLKGETLGEIYESVAMVADHWLDLLFTKGATVSEEELFELICEKRCMSRKIDEYGGQKSTSLKTAHRLAEFLGDEMVKDSGLSFKFIISKKPEGAPITERAVPLAIFQTEDSVKRHYLRKWLKQPDLEDFDIRGILDWEYYIDRFSSNVQKIITIPAAIQGIQNPVSRIVHPDWLQKRLMEKEDVFKQRRIDELFSVAPKSQVKDIENVADRLFKQPIENNKKKRIFEITTTIKHWREELGDPPVRKETNLNDWLRFHRKKWAIQKAIKERRMKENIDPVPKRAKSIKSSSGGALLPFIERTRQLVAGATWEIVQLAETGTPGEYRLWAMMAGDLHWVTVSVPRIFYFNTRIPKDDNELLSMGSSNINIRKVLKTLPRNHPVYHLYEYRLDERLFAEHKRGILRDLIEQNESEGIYELNVPLLMRALLGLGCLVAVDGSVKANLLEYLDKTRPIEIDLLKQRTVAQHSYLSDGKLRAVLVFHTGMTASQQAVGIWDPVRKVAVICLLSPNKPTPEFIRVAQNLLRNEQLNDNNEIDLRIFSSKDEAGMFRQANAQLVDHKRECRAFSVMIVLMSNNNNPVSAQQIPILTEFPLVSISNNTDVTADQGVKILDWDRKAVGFCVNAFSRYSTRLEQLLERARYLHVPIGNISPFVDISNSCDLIYARYLQKMDYVLWCSSTSEPDLGGKVTRDLRLSILDTEIPAVVRINRPSCYRSVTIRWDMTYFTVNALIAMNRISDDLDGCRTFESSTVSSRPVEELLRLRGDPRNQNHNASRYEDTAAAVGAFRVFHRMVSDWITDVKQYRNVVADEHLCGFFRWLRDPNALLYDSALHKTLRKLMRKVFFKLMEQLTTFRIDVVYADYNQLVLCSRRTDIGDASRHCQQALDNIKRQPVFSLLEFQPSDCWKLLLWADTANYSGIKAAEQKDRNTDVVDEDDNDTNWHLARYLSPDPLIHMRFLRLVDMFMHSVCKIITDTPLTNDGTGRGPDVSEYPSVRERIDSYFAGPFTDMIYTTSDDLHSIASRYREVRLDDGDSNDLAPLLPLIEPVSKQPLVDFVRTVDFVLSLDGQAADGHTNRWRQNMMRLLTGTDGLGYVDRWRWPYAATGKENDRRNDLVIVVPEVMCDHCYMTRDLDMCRDLYVDQFNDQWWFFCFNCQNPYSKDAVEMVIVDMLDGLVKGALLQDIQCNKCRTGVLGTSLSRAKTCESCGTFISVTKDSSILKQQIAVIEDIGRRYKLRHLTALATKFRLK